MKFLTSSVAAAALALALSACAPAPEETPVAEAPAAAAAPAIAPIPASADVKPFTIGELQAAALLDGGPQFPNDNKTLATNKTKAEVDAVLTAAGLPLDTISLSLQPMLVKSADKVMLFDTGAGSNMGALAGKLPASLTAAGVDPATVTDIFISHAHGDHVGGLVTAAGALAFPNAVIHISANEWAALQANAQMAAMIPVITPKVVAFEAGADIIPGVVKADDIQGHTPGHSAYTITSGTNSLLYLGDTAHHSVVSVQHPDWTIRFDGDAPTAEASRKQVLEAAAASGQRVYAVHFPFPGLGKFEKQGETVVWVPEAG
jgi:glyoxylase-like metal-dependent hydrolase (beta-lactamase superfamily II)